VQFTADGQRGWVVGNDGTILRGEQPEQKESGTAVDEGKRKIDAAKLDIQRFEKEIGSSHDHHDFRPPPRPCGQHPPAG
jgi:photosystem II stability/assembly factor-like uncharacterized protein